MGNQYSEFPSNDSPLITINSDVAFRTSNYLPVETKVAYIVIFEDYKTSADDQISDLDNCYQSDCHNLDNQLSKYAENRRSFLRHDSSIYNFINKGYTLVTIWPLPSESKFAIILAKCDPSSFKASILNIVNTQLKMQRLEGETLVVGSQKLVLAGSDKDDSYGSKDDLLETIAHETANGGRLIAAWPISESVEITASRIDVLFEVPESSNDQYFAYQVSMLDDPFLNYDRNKENEHRNIGSVSDFMHKALEAGWGLVDVALVNINNLVWFFERRVTDALINEPSFEGRLLEIEVNLNNTISLADELNTLGQTGWMLKSVLQIPFEVATNRNTFIAFFQRPVQWSRIPQQLPLNRIVDYSTRNQAIRTNMSCDQFAPPNYPLPLLTPYGSYNLATNTVFNQRVDDDESELPLYEDIIQHETK
ncbi:hypothetical protein GJ496_010332 [Pomphorhynchus laevis]|nr:hypothetical protein GJ496_010332 [Pomphorhynchus laevis]